jgi:predicted nuclease of predicted toxin-antitoxin system
LRFLADMNISPLTVEALAAEGVDIVRVSSLLPVNAPDEKILALAREQGRVVITQDMDFSALLALGGYDQPRLVTLRLLNTDPPVVTERLRAILPQIADALRRDRRGSHRARATTADSVGHRPEDRLGTTL